MSATVADLDNDGTAGHLRRQRRDGELLLPQSGRRTIRERGGRSAAWPLVKAVRASRRWDRPSATSIGDGWLDVYIPDMGYGCLLMNKEGVFEDRTARSKLAVICGQYTGWGGVLFDWDNDGYLDLFVANGNAHFEYPEEDVLAQNDGQGNFIDIAARSGEYFHQKYVGRGATYGDYDNDGDMDLLVVNLNDTARLLAQRRRQPAALAETGRPTVRTDARRRSGRGCR